LGLLSVENVSRAFGGLAALFDVSFSVEENSFTSLIGPNGAGKTTMLNVISRIEALDQGRIFFAGKLISQMRPDQLSSLGIGRTFQLVRVFPGLTALESVMIGTHAQTKTEIFDALFRPTFAQRENRKIEEDARELLKLVGVDEVKFNMKAGQLSSSERRGVELARMLIAKPKLLLLDEPTSGLDATEVEWWTNQIKSLQKRLGLTILLVEHRVRLVMELSDKIIVLNFGEKVAEGSPEGVANDPVVRKSYLGESYVKD
jgi:branched-chain amino acid transport system ATP-binding protein